MHDINSSALEGTPLEDDHNERRRPRTFPYSSLLPFATESQEDRLNHLNHIVANLYVAISGEFLAVAPLLHWTRELRSWLQLKFDMPVSTRTKLAGVYYELALSQGMTLSASDKFANTFMVLAQKRTLVDQEQLILDWRLLFREFKKISFPNQWTSSIRNHEKDPEVLSRIGSCAKRFFPPGSVIEILEEVLPLYNTNRQNSAQQVLSILNALLPSEGVPEGYEHLYPQKWLPSLFHLWALFTRSQQYDLVMMDILSRLAMGTLQASHIPFSSTGIYTKEQTAVMFTCALRLLEVPVGRSGSPYLSSFDTSAPKSDSKRNRAAPPIARWIVRSLSPESLNDPDSTLRGLQGLLQSVETFFHPSNSGTWTKNLTYLVQSLADYFVLRWNGEQSGEVEVPENRRLTPEVRREFVLALKDVVFMGIHSKSSTAAMQSQAALKCLAKLEPEIILPIMLRQSYSSLQGLVETHRTITSLKTLTLLSQTLVKHKQSRLHVTALLGLAIPGIDANDLTKTVQSLAFIQSIASYVPFVDFSEGSTSDLALEYITGAIDSFENDEAGSVMQLSDEDELAVLKSSTASFGEFIISFMGRIFSLLENLPDAVNSRARAAPEQNVVNMLPATFSVVLGALSDDLFDLVLDKFTDFITNHVIPQASDAMANLMACLAEAQPERTFTKLFTVLEGNIREEIDENHAGTAKSLEMVPKDRALVWYLCMFRKAVWTAGSVLLKYRSQLFDLIIYLREKCRGAASVHTSNLMHHTIFALTNIYSCDGKLLSHAELQRRSYSISDWGRQLNPHELGEIRWHVPTKEEVEFAVDVFDKNVTISISELERLMEEGVKPNKDWSEEMTRQLNYLRLLISGAAILYDPKRMSASISPALDVSDVPKESDDVEMTEPASDVDMFSVYPVNSNVDNDEQLDEDLEEEDEGDDDHNGEGDDGDANSIKKTFTYPVGYYFTDTSDPIYIRVHALHDKIGIMLHSVHEYLHSKHEDDVHSLKTLSSVYRVWFIDVGTERSLKLLDTYIRSYLADARLYRFAGSRKCYPRYLLVKRAFIYHLQRIRHNNGARDMSELDKILLTDLLQDSLSRYADTRRQAQHSLESAIRVLSGSRLFLVPKIVAELNDAVEKKEYDRAKGAMYTLNIRGLCRFASKDHRFFTGMALALLKAARIDKPSIHELARSLLLTFVVTVRLSPRSVYFSDEFGSVLSAIKPDEDLSERIKQGDEKRAKTWNDTWEQVQELENELIKQFKEQPHWRIAFIITTLLIGGMWILNPQLSPELGEIFFKGAIDSHPHLRFLLVQGALRLMNVCYVRGLCGNDMKRLIQGDFEDVDSVTIPVDHNDVNFTDKFLSLLNDPDAPYYHSDKDRPGWLVWGKSFLAEAHPAPQILPNFTEDDLKVVSRSAILMDLDWFSTFCDILVQEPRPEQDAFRGVYAMFTVTVFALIDAGRTSITWQEAEDKITEVYGDGKDKNRHRAVAELLAGMMTNTKSTEYVRKANAFGVRIFSSVLDDELTPENLPYWTGFIGYVSMVVDPRSIWPLVQKLTSVRIDATSNAAFKESSRISLLRHFLSKASWTFQNYKPIMDDFLGHLDHSYKGVREEIGRTLGALPRHHYYESFKDVSTLLESNYEAGPLGVRPYQPTASRTALIANVFGQLEVWRKERQPLQETSSYANGSKTVMIWFESWLSYPCCSELIPFFPKLILPELLNLLDIKDDTEITPLAVKIFKHFGNVPCPPHLLRDIISGIEEIVATSNSWHQRSRVLAVVQVFYFRQLFQLSTADRKSLFDCVSGLLSDPQLEVRDTAATTLSGMIRCSPAAFRNSVVKKLQKQFTKMLEDNAMPGRPDHGSRSRSAARPSTSSSPASAEYNTMILHRHAAVLGLSALVQAFPYQSPPPAWIPAVLTTLATKAANDAGMVGRSVKTALGEFKKTRQDTWHVDSRIFDMDQLEDLEGVLWRSYFA